MQALLLDGDLKTSIVKVEKPKEVTKGLEDFFSLCVHSISTR